MIRDIRIEYVSKRCEKCGTYWAIEQGRAFTHECPRCGGYNMASKNEDVLSLKRQIRSLRGAITRMKRK